MTNQKVIVLELNELMFDNIKYYTEQGKLENFSKILSNSKLAETKAEDNYEELEPWIQWVSVHTGKKFADHKTFRLGDFRNSNIEQIWEKLEKKGHKCMAISPMNAKNRLSEKSIFIPDPWSDQNVNGNYLDKLTFGSIKRAVNANAQNKLGLKDLLILFTQVLSLGDVRIFINILNILVKYKNSKWSKAIVLDYLLAKITLSKFKSNKPDFTTLFLNAGAHIQHHYLFSSESYKGSNTNPAWYDDGKLDPLYAVYSIYDQIIGDFLRLDAKLLIATGLSQIENEKPQFYYRPKNHKEFLDFLNINYSNVEERMSRDFLISFNNKKYLDESTKILSSCSIKGKSLFKLDIRDKDIFCKVAYYDEIKKDEKITIQNKKFKALDYLVHVSIENSIHQTTGYFLEVGNNKVPSVLNLEALFQYQEKLIVNK